MDADAERKRKKHHHSDKHHRSERHEKKKHKSDRRDDERRAEKKHKKEHSDAGPQLPPGMLPNGAESLTDDDYFKQSATFRTWLKDERRTYLEDLTSEESRRLFKKFVSKWNWSELPTKYYEFSAASGSSSGQPAASRTKHTWAFASKLSDADQLAIDRAVSKVAKGGD